MLFFILALYIILITLFLISGIKNNNEKVILSLNFLLWIGSLFPSYFTYLTIAESGYSENWSAIMFFILTIPYFFITLIFMITELYLIRRWTGPQSKSCRITAIALLVFLSLLVIAGLLSA